MVNGATKRLYTLALEDEALQALAAKCPELKIVALATHHQSITQIAADLRHEGVVPSVLLIGGDWPHSPGLVELCKELRQVLPETELVYFGRSLPTVHLEQAQQLGVAEYIVGEPDIDKLSILLGRHLDISSKQDLRPVFLMDLRPGDTLAFNTYLYLPMNRKYIKFTGVGGGIDPQRLEKLKERGQVQIYVEAKDLTAFYRYAAERLKSLNAREAVKMGLTERREKLVSIVGDLLHALFDSSQESTHEQGKDLLACCQGIIANFITNGRHDDWYDRVLAAAGSTRDRYQYASTVSTLAALFALGADMEHPEDLAYAGLFADLGLTRLPTEISTKSAAQMTATERAIYFTHPEQSVTYLRQRKVPVKDTILRAIREHHEAYDGSGYPRGVHGDEISQEGQILAFAVLFVELTWPQFGRSPVSPVVALEQIARQKVVSPELIKKLQALFPVKRPAPEAE